MKLKWTSPQPSLLVYYMVKLTGLAPFTLKKNRFHPPTLLGKLYPVFVTAAYVLLVSETFTPAMETIYKGKYSVFMKLWSTILYLIGLPSILFTFVIFLSMYKKIVHLLNKMCIMSDELKSLGIQEDHGQYFRIMFASAVMANSTLIAVCLILILLEPHWPIILSIKYCVDTLIGLNTVLIFVQTLTFIRQRFVLLNGKLYDLIPDPHLKLSQHSWIMVVCTKVGDKNRLGSKALTDLQRIRKMEALHLELCHMVDRTTRIFATPILLNSLRISAQFMLSSYWMYFIFHNSKYFEIHSILCTLLKMAITTVLLFMITRASSITCEQGNATRAVLFKVWIKFRSVELRNEFLMFSIQLMNTPVVVTAFGIIDLGHSFAFKIFTISVPYLIVMIQLAS